MKWRPSYNEKYWKIEFNRNRLPTLKREIFVGGIWDLNIDGDFIFTFYHNNKWESFDNCFFTKSEAQSKLTAIKQILKGK